MWQIGKHDVRNILIGGGILAALYYLFKGQWPPTNGGNGNGPPPPSDGVPPPSEGHGIPGEPSYFVSPDGKLFAVTKEGLSQWIAHMKQLGYTIIQTMSIPDHRAYHIRYYFTYEDSSQHIWYWYVYYSGAVPPMAPPPKDVFSFYLEGTYDPRSAIDYLYSLV